jgi:hypothetical protein
LVAATWAFRHRAERESELRFARLARELAQLGALDSVVQLARRSSREEHRHSQLCAAVCAIYGGQPTHSPVHDHPATWPGLTGRDGTLYEVVSFACIAETLNAQLLTVILERATVTSIRRVIRRLLKDEINHGRMGWAHLSAERSHGRGEFLSEILPAMLAGSVEDELFDTGPDPVDGEAIAHGELRRADRRTLWAAALDDAILPGFEAFGVDCRPAAAWVQRRLRGA